MTSASVYRDVAALGPNDSLVLFFAGHGHTVTRTYDGGARVKDGYLIPADGDRPGGRAGTWLRLAGWLTEIEITRLPAKHILVLLDACHSGLALDPIIRWRGKDMRLMEPLEQLRTRRSRRIITSALDDQLAMDSGPVPGHSLFTGCLIEGVVGSSSKDVWAVGDTNFDGCATNGRQDNDKLCPAIILHYDGKVWHTENGTDARLNAVWSGGGEVWTVGEKGAVLKLRSK